MSAISLKPYTLQNTIQHYAWGTRDAAAFIPKLLGVPAEPGVPYAELWIGAHPKAPSTVLAEEGEMALDAWIAQHADAVLGEAVAARFHGKLPFLLKVLSAGEALSIQAHPSKAQAKALHTRDPEHYPDANHKPEIAIALNRLTALVGVKPLDELLRVLKHYPEIVAFISREVAGQITDAVGLGSVEADMRVHRVVTGLIERARSDPQALAEATAALDRRLSRPRSTLTEEERIFLDLVSVYPGDDLGLLMPFLLNVVHLEAGQGIYIAPGVPHAYLIGNIVECMATSDNVVRVGLTPKFKDADALLQILDARPRPAHILNGDPEAEETIYTTPAAEFEVTRWKLRRGRQYRHETGNRPVILLPTTHKVVLSWPTGSRSLRRGQSVLIPAIVPWYSLTSYMSAEVFRATVPE